MTEDPVKMIKQIDFFKEFSPDEIRMLLDAGEWVKAQSGEPVIMEGDEDLYLYVILKGSANVIKQEKVLTTMEAGTSFGEIGAIVGGPRSAYVIALGECFLLRFHPDQINELPTEVQLKLVKKLLYTMTSRLLEMDRRFVQ